MCGKKISPGTQGNGLNFLNFVTKLFLFFGANIPGLTQKTFFAKGIFCTLLEGGP